MGNFVKTLQRDTQTIPHYSIFQGGGCALMGRQRKFEQIVRGMVEVDMLFQQQ